MDAVLSVAEPLLVKKSCEASDLGTAGIPHGHPWAVDFSIYLIL